MTYPRPYRDELPPTQLPPSARDQPRLYRVALYSSGNRNLTAGRELAAILDLAPGAWAEEAARRLDALTRRLLAQAGITDTDRVDHCYLELRDWDTKKVVMEWVPTWVEGEERLR